MGSSSNVVRGGSFALAGLLSGSKSAAMSTYPTYTQASAYSALPISHQINTAGTHHASSDGMFGPGRKASCL